MEFDYHCLRYHITRQRILKLNDLSLTDKDLQIIARALPHYPELLGMDLSGNEISQEGVVDLIKVLETKCPNIKQLNLSANQISDACLPYLFKNKSLHLTLISLNSTALHAEHDLAKHTAINHKQYRRELSLFTRAGTVLCQGHRQTKHQLSKLDVNLVVNILLYLADIKDSDLHQSMLCLFLLNHYHGQNHFKTKPISVDEAHQALTPAEKLMAKQITKTFSLSNQ